jgi:hypothetical protein
MIGAREAVDNLSCQPDSNDQSWLPTNSPAAPEVIAHTSDVKGFVRRQRGVGLVVLAHATFGAQ